MNACVVAQPQAVIPKATEPDLRNVMGRNDHLDQSRT